MWAQQISVRFVRRAMMLTPRPPNTDADTRRPPSKVPSCIQGSLEHVEGLLLSGLQEDSAKFEALGRMPQLRILIMDGVKTSNVLSGLHLPRLAMLSWRDAHGSTLPFDAKVAKAAAVLDISNSKSDESSLFTIGRVAAEFQACLLISCPSCRCFPQNSPCQVIMFVENTQISHALLFTTQLFGQRDNAAS